MCARRGRRAQAYLAKVDDGRVVHRRLGTGERPTSLKVGPDGTVWFGLLHRYRGGAYGYWKAGRITAAGDLAEYRLPGSAYYPGAVGLEGRFWFQGWLHGSPALDSIGVDGQLGKPACADPSCSLEPTAIAAAPDGSLWYGLRGQNLNTGGGGSGIAIEEAIGNQAGSVAHYVP
jgi:streptogramin lyase